MTNRGFLEECVRRFGKVKFKVPISDLHPDINNGSRFGSSYHIGGLMERAKRRMLAQNPIVPNAADIVNWILWDTYKVAASTTIGASFQFFTQPIGTNSKTAMDTNMEQVQRLPDPQWMNVISLGFEFGPDMLVADVNTLVNNYYTDFIVGNKTYAQGRYENFPTGGAVDASATVKNGQPSWVNQFDLRLPQGIDLGIQTDPNSGAPGRVVSDGLIGVTILQGQQFKVNNTAPGGAQSTGVGNGLRLVCQLYGILSRGVQ